MTKIGYAVLALGVAMAGVAGCKKFTKATSSARTAVALFHEQYNASQFAEVYAQATPELRKSSPEPEFTAFMQSVRRKLGAYQNGRQTGFNTSFMPSGTFVKLGWEAQFERGTAQENFVFIATDSGAVLQGYHVNSPALVIDAPAATITGIPGVKTAEDWQREAVQRYPELGLAGSPLNAEFVARHKRYQREQPTRLNDPAWPLQLAEESVQALRQR